MGDEAEYLYEQDVAEIAYRDNRVREKCNCKKPLIPASIEHKLDEANRLLKEIEAALHTGGRHG